MGRRHLIFVAVLAAAAALAASAGAAITWSELQRGTAIGGTVKAPLGYVAYARGDGSRFASHIPGAKGRLVDVDFKHRAVLAVVGEFGCQDTRIAVRSVVQHGSTLAVGLAKFPLGKGQLECQAIFPTFRLLTIGKAELTRPYPTRVTVTVARA
jgi:opacity protein-like surface antigen